MKNSAREPKTEMDGLENLRDLLHSRYTEGFSQADKSITCEQAYRLGWVAASRMFFELRGLASQTSGK